MDPRAASERQASPSQGRRADPCGGGDEEARGSGGTCSVAVSGTWALSSSEGAQNPALGTESKAQNVLGKTPSRAEAVTAPGDRVRRLALSQPLETHQVQSFRGRPAACTRIDHLRLGPRKFAWGLARRVTQRRSLWPLGPAAARAGHGARTSGGAGRLNGPGPRHPSCPLGLELNKPSTLLGSVVSVPGSTQPGL